ncbi:hypothetical protein L596_004401 [Steinernema carpocapsae]|uniref:Uncharacterized protein n=1 Tax=Steinernema carpocapsae TaxID=34508 RepID=A0A4U8UZT3_STECR|nr:hypothetical protein L596_004401 [Steinernema carpocapsae]
MNQGGCFSLFLLCGSGMFSSKRPLLALFVFLLPAVLAIHSCFQGRSDHDQLDVEVSCYSDECAIVKYSRTSYKERLCHRDLAKQHPALLYLNCPDGDRTFCLNQTSTRIITDSPIDLVEETYGEVLKYLEINEFCCCRGESCNAKNPEMEKYYRQVDHHRHRHHHRHKHHHPPSPSGPRHEYYPGGEMDSGNAAALGTTTTVTFLVAFTFLL